MKTTMSAYFAKIIFFVFVIQAIGSDSFDLGGADSRTEDVYLGWPHVIECARYHWRSTLCKIYEKTTGKHLYDQSIAAPTRRWHRGLNLGDVTENTPTEYVITLQHETTGEIENVELYTLNITNLPQQTAQQAMEDERLLKYSSVIGDWKVMYCERRDDASIAMHVPRANQTCSWYYNGTEITTFDEFYDHEEGACTIQLPSVQIEQYGVYSCAHNYNGQSRFMDNHRLCYRPSVTINKETMVCPTEPFKAKVGTNTTISVMASLGNGRHSQLDMAFKWRKQEIHEWLCWNGWAGIQSKVYRKGHNNDVQCEVIELPLPEENCTMDIASINPEDTFENVVEVKLIFNTLTESDFGVYVLKHQPAWELKKDLCKITLQKI